MRKTITLLVLTIALFMSSCGSNRGADQTGYDSASPTGTETDAPTGTPVISPLPVEESAKEPIETPKVEYQQEANDFSLYLGNRYITLRDWDRDNYVVTILGQPINESAEVLGEGADTYEGSSIRALEYQGLTVRLFRGSTEYWIMEMVVTDEKYKTFRGISVNMSVNDLKAEYDDVFQALDGRTDADNCGYILHDAEKFIWFEVENGVIKELKYYVELG